MEKIYKDLYKLKRMERKAWNEVFLEKTLSSIEQWNVANCQKDFLARLKEPLYLLKMAGNMVLYESIMPLEKEDKKKTLASILQCSPKQIAYGMQEFYGQKKFKYYIGNFLYKESIPLNKILSLEVIWGDIDMGSLKEIVCLDNLKIVMGNLFCSSTERMDLPSLEYVYGDLHIENLKDVKGLSNLKYVQGNIFYESKVLPIAEFKSLLYEKKYITLYTKKYTK